jgi:short-subunit dehydrogenase
MTISDSRKLKSTNAQLLAQPARQVALVTGGASGIGRALCEELAARGMIIVVADIDTTGAEAVATAIGQRGCCAQAITLDVSRASEVAQAVNDIAATHRRLDYVFNNAAVAIAGEIRDGNVADFRRLIDVNLFGVIHGTMAAYRIMISQGFGHIVNIGSITGLIPTPFIAAYSASKWAIVGFSQAVRAEARALGVNVTVACPGLVRTGIGERNVYWNVRKTEYLARLPLRWALEPAQAAAAILRGVARNRRIVVFPLSARVAWWFYRACPFAFSPLLRRIVSRFRGTRIIP